MRPPPARRPARPWSGRGARPRFPVWSPSLTRRAGVAASSRWASLRVRSSDGTSSRVSPSASASTRNSPRPASVRAATSSVSATCPSSTQALRPSSSKPSPLARCTHLDAARVPASVRLGPGDRDDATSRGDSGEQVLLRGAVRAELERVGGEHGVAKEGSAGQSTPHFLHGDQQLDVGVARAAVLLGDDQSRESELLGHLAPGVGVPSSVGRHLLAHDGLAGLVGEERAYCGAQLVVLIGELEVECHARFSTAATSAARPSRARPCRRAARPGVRAPARPGCYA